MIDRDGWNPAPKAGVIRAINGKGRQLSIGLAAFDRATHDEMMRAPAVVTSLTVGGQRAGEIARGESRDIVGHTELLHGTLKGKHAAADFVQQFVMGTVCIGWLIGPAHQNLRSVGVITTDSAEEDLAVHVELVRHGSRAISPGMNHPRHHFQLIAQGGVWKWNRPKGIRCRWTNRRVQEIPNRDRIFNHVSKGSALEIAISKPKNAFHGSHSRTAAAHHVPGRGHGTGGGDLVL